MDVHFKYLLTPTNIAYLCLRKEEVKQNGGRETPDILTFNMAAAGSNTSHTLESGSRSS